MCEYCGNERKAIHSEIMQKKDAIINTVIGLDEDGYLVTSTILHTAHTLRPYRLESRTAVDVCPMCGQKTELCKKLDV